MPLRTSDLQGASANRPMSALSPSTPVISMTPSS
nr:MAG TPA: hypothetical protein [Caudoviricetes sp.]